MAEEVPLSSPQITEEDIASVVRVLRSGRLSIGPLQESFEAEIARATARRRGVACSSGTAGLHMALLALGVGPGDEVITTPFSFIASSNAILYAGATPVFVDIEPTSLNINPDLIEAAITPKTKAILAVETFGNPAHMDVYRRIADKHEVWLIEDACEGLGGRWKGRPIGSWGHVGVFGFYPNKQITTGEGGMIVTDDDRVADACRSLRNQGRAPSGAWMSFERIGFNYRLSEIAAALGVTQARRLPEILEARQAVADRYVERFMDHPDLILPTIAEGTSMSWFVFVVRLSGDFVADDRDRIIAGMHRHDVGAAAYFPCIHLQPAYRELFGFEQGAFPVAEHVAQRTIALPFSTVLSPRDQEFAASTFELMLGRETLRRD
jgi:perosamine synthetase